LTNIIAQEKKRDKKTHLSNRIQTRHQHQRQQGFVQKKKKNDEMSIVRAVTTFMSVSTEE
jgi:hypothetical protein